MSTRSRNEPAGPRGACGAAGDRLDRALAALRELDWDGPDHHPRVDAALKEQAMQENNNRIRLSRPTLAAVVASTFLVGGAVGAVVHRAMSTPAVFETDDGRAYDVILTPEGAGAFQTEDGRVFNLDVVDGAAPMLVRPDETDRPENQSE